MDAVVSFDAMDAVVSFDNVDALGIMGAFDSVDQ